MGFLNPGNIGGNSAGRSRKGKGKKVGIASEEDINKILSAEAGITRTLNMIGGIGGAIGGIAGSLGSAAGSLGGAAGAAGGASGGIGGLLGSIGGGAEGAGGFLSSIGQNLKEGFGGGTVKGFFSQIGKGILDAKNEAFDVFRNIRGNESFKPLNPGAPENNAVGLNAQDFLSSIMQQFGQGAKSPTRREKKK